MSNVPAVQGVVVHPHHGHHHHGHHHSDSETGTSSGSESEGPVANFKGQPLYATPAYVRRNFIVKVYTILSFQLMLTVMIAAPIAFLIDPKTIAGAQTIQGLYYFGLISTFGLMCCMACSGGGFLKKYPSNYIFLFVFTVFESILVGAISSLYAPVTVIMAVGATIVIFLGLTAYACCTKTDFTGAGPYLFAALLALMGMGFVMMIMSFFMVLPPWVQRLYALIGVIIFSFYIVYDTQLIVGGNHKIQFDIDDYCFAALNLYLDIINLFLLLLSLLSGDRS